MAQEVDLSKVLKEIQDAIDAIGNLPPAGDESARDTRAQADVALRGVRDLVTSLALRGAAGCVNHISPGG